MSTKLPENFSDMIKVNPPVSTNFVSVRTDNGTIIEFVPLARTRDASEFMCVAYLFLLDNDDIPKQKDIIHLTRKLVVTGKEQFAAGNEISFIENFLSAMFEEWINTAKQWEEMTKGYSTGCIVAFEPQEFKFTPLDTEGSL